MTMLVLAVLGGVLATGTMRTYHFREGQHDQQNRVVARLLAQRDANTTRGDH